MAKKFEIDDMDSLIAPILRQIEFDRLQIIARHYDLPLASKEDYHYALCVKTVYDGWLAKLYGFEDIDDPENKAYDLTAATLKLFGKKKLDKNKIRLEGKNK